MGKWCTVTTIDEKGERHSLDVRAESTYDAAHLYVATAKSQLAALLPNRLPVPRVKTVFEVVADGTVYRVHGAALQRWIMEHRQELNGPKGKLFSERPTLD